MFCFLTKRKKTVYTGKDILTHTTILLYNTQRNFQRHQRFQIQLSRGKPWSKAPILRDSGRLKRLGLFLCWSSLPSSLSPPLNHRLLLGSPSRTLSHTTWQEVFIQAHDFTMVFTHTHMYHTVTGLFGFFFFISQSNFTELQIPMFLDLASPYWELTPQTGLGFSWEMSTRTWFLLTSLTCPPVLRITHLLSCKTLEVKDPNLSYSRLHTYSLKECAV